MDTVETGIIDLLHALEVNTKMIEQSVNLHIDGSIDISL